MDSQQVPSTVYKLTISGHEKFVTNYMYKEFQQVPTQVTLHTAER